MVFGTLGIIEPVGNIAIKIDITQEHIDKAIAIKTLRQIAGQPYQASKNDPIAIALKERGYDGISVFVPHIKYKENNPLEKRFAVLNRDDFLQFIKCWDNGLEVKPFTLEIR